MIPVDTVTAEQVVIATAMAIVIAAVLAERCRLLVRTGSARLGELATATGLLAGALAVGLVVGPVMRATWDLVADLAPVRLSATSTLADLAVAFVAWDLAGYWYHRIGHCTRLGWAAHRPHHTGTHYDLSLAWRQSWFPWMALVTFPLVALTGASFAVATTCAAVSEAWQALVHAGGRDPTPAGMRRWVTTPAVHRVHHDTDDAVNLAPVLVVWDRLFGTWREPVAVARTDRLACADPEPNPVRIQWRAWRELVGPVA